MLIPPSIILLLYGIVTETSVVRLFFAGVIPGLMLALGNILTVMVIAWRLKLPRAKFDRKRIWPETIGRVAGARHAGRDPRRALRRALHARPKPRPPRAATPSSTASSASAASS